tara:strand:- start:11711 stop:11863 length:153 start_codon:yes stop_codon:yes gene_type:complete
MGTLALVIAAMLTLVALEKVLPEVWWEYLFAALIIGPVLLLVYSIFNEIF